MILNFSIALPDERSGNEVAAYLREQADNAASQIEEGIIAVPRVDDMVYIDINERGVQCAVLFRSE